MQLGVKNINTPYFIGDVTSLITSELRIPVQHLLKETFENGHQYMAVGSH